MPRPKRKRKPRPKPESPAEELGRCLVFVVRALDETRPGWSKTRSSVKRGCEALRLLGCEILGLQELHDEREATRDRHDGTFPIRNTDVRRAALGE